MQLSYKQRFRLGHARMAYTQGALSDATERGAKGAGRLGGSLAIGSSELALCELVRWQGRLLSATIPLGRAKPVLQ